MHEMSLAEGVIQIVAESADQEGFSRVKRLWLEIGRLSHVEPEALRFCFDAVSRGTLAEGAQLDILEVPGQAWCHECGRTVAQEARYDPCPLCGGYQVQTTGGDEMRIKELEVE